ncbi:capping protein inhibiting regulator of actin dynamics [Coregonus clupeaformis]|uniref:capping protein inhibiting regulator of actin dynamics n=1 Tax=Coregonus clupeaformis TaxID=59861 RepID=UPI001BE0B354|nr:capping protein inhibiting regulator of actin dynamics [Coregonus clupeaformis]
MDHVIQFEGIPMSKSMRGMCKEEDYAFLGEKGKHHKETDTLGEDWKEEKMERERRRRERAQQEQERIRELEESRKEKEQQWRHHVAELASTQDQRLRDRLARIHHFRDFQRKVLVEEMSLQTDSESSQALDQLLTRI